MSNNCLATLLVAPIVSEKSVNAADQANQYVFKVGKSARKLEIKKAVEQMFKVEVESVQTLNMKGKSKRFGRNIGRRSDWKKAYVRLKPGFEIEFGTTG